MASSGLEGGGGVCSTCSAHGASWFCHAPMQCQSFSSVLGTQHCLVCTLVKSARVNTSRPSSLQVCTSSGLATLIVICTESQLGAHKYCRFPFDIGNTCIGRTFINVNANACCWWLLRLRPHRFEQYVCVLIK